MNVCSLPINVRRRERDVLSVIEYVAAAWVRVLNFEIQIKIDSMDENLKSENQIRNLVISCTNEMREIIKRTHIL